MIRQGHACLTLTSTKKPHAHFLDIFTDVLGWSPELLQEEVHTSGTTTACPQLTVTLLHPCDHRFSYQHTCTFMRKDSLNSLQNMPVFTSHLYTADGTNRGLWSPCRKSDAGVAPPHLAYTHGCLFSCKHIHTGTHRFACAE